jgi:hypothetical protein
MIFRLLEALRVVIALETREVDSQMWITSLSDYPGKNVPFGKGILPSSAREVNAKHHTVNSDRANPSSTSVALFTWLHYSQTNILEKQTLLLARVRFIRAPQAVFWFGFSKNSWRGLFCDSVKSCENYYFAIQGH